MWPRISEFLLAKKTPLRCWGIRLTATVLTGILFAAMSGCASAPEPGSLEDIKQRAARAEAKAYKERVCAQALADARCHGAMRCEVYVPVGRGRYLVCRH